jgi:protein subunit release factor A
MSAKFTITRKDLEISYFSGSGCGGQHRNKHDNCVRIKHPPTGVIVTGQDHKERQRNMKDALTRLTNHFKFRWWCDEQLREMEGLETTRQWVDSQMKEDNYEVYIQKVGKFFNEKTGEFLDKLVEKQYE